MIITTESSGRDSVVLRVELVGTEANAVRSSRYRLALEAVPAQSRAPVTLLPVDIKSLELELTNGFTLVKTETLDDLRDSLFTSERERDRYKDELVSCVQQLGDIARVANVAGWNGVENPKILSDFIRGLGKERDALQRRLDEQEADMHTRIRAEYDKTIADSWRAKVAEVEAERDAARTSFQAALKSRLEERAKWEERTNRALDVAEVADRQRDALRSKVAEVEAERNALMAKLTKVEAELGSARAESRIVASCRFLSDSELDEVRRIIGAKPGESTPDAARWLVGRACQHTTCPIRVYGSGSRGAP